MDTANNVNPKTGQPWANTQEMIDYIQELQTALKNKNGGNKQPEVRITLDTGEVQLRHLTGAAITFSAETWLKLFGLAPMISDCIKNNKHMLVAPGDDEVALTVKKVNREGALAAGNPVIRKPKSTKIQTA